ncbi:MAG: TonB-dependent receptor [Pseudomonadota bacterium]
MSRRHSPQLLFGIVCTAFIAVAAAAPSVLAQSFDHQDSSGIVDTIVVTGSNMRARRRDFQAPSPVQTIGQMGIKDTGALQFQDLLKGITANTGSLLAQDVTVLQGTSQFSLRGLGVGSTLTLINGRRAGLAPVVDSSGQLFTDVNQFPVNMIDRIEILTDGASATYGSEAVAGVINIFTRDDFSGFELTIEARDTTNQSGQIGAAFGAQGDRGGIVIFGNVYAQSEAYRSDFPNILEGSRFEDGAAGAWDSATGSPGRFNLAIPDSAIEGGWRRAATDSIADPDCAAAGGIFDALESGGSNCRYYFIDQRRILPAEYRLQMFSSADYDVTDRLTVFSEVGFSRNDIRDQNGGMLTRRFTNDGGFLVPADHPFNFFTSDGAGGVVYAGPEAFAVNPSLEAAPLIYRGRIIGRDGDRENGAEIKTLFTNTRIVGGFDYSVKDNWILYGSYTWSNADFNRRAPREWDIETFADQIVAGAWNPFGTRLTNPDLISPRDGVSTAENTPEVQSSFDLLRNDQALVRQSVAELSLSGEAPIDLPGGRVAIAVGAQYRDVRLEDVPDGRYQTGDNRLNETIPPVFGAQDVYALFGEAHFPFLDGLELQAAVRYEDYGDQGGDTFDPKVAVKWDVTDSVALRGSWGTSFQAPSIRQVAGVVGAASINDPLDPTGGAFIVTVITTGSDDLKPQSAENFNLGLMFRSEQRFEFSIDYFHYDYHNLILPGADPQVIFDQAAAGELPAERALRSADGQPATAIANFVNNGSAKASGLDIAATYSRPFGDSNIRFDVKSTVFTMFTSSEFGDILGNRNFSNGFGSTPDFRLNAGATYVAGAHRLNIAGRYIGAYTDDQSETEITRNFTVDVRYDVHLGKFFGLESDATTLSLGSVNLFNENPPRLPLRPNLDFEVHDPRKRQVYLSLKQTF